VGGVMTDQFEAVGILVRDDGDRRIAVERAFQVAQFGSHLIKAGHIYKTTGKYFLFFYHV
jgi:hypothetical protein